MRIKRSQLKLITFILLGSLGCITIWQVILQHNLLSNFPLKTPTPSSRPRTSQKKAEIVYKLYTKNSTVCTHPIEKLPVTDYNRLIDLDFNFTMLNFPCNGSDPLLLVLIHSAAKNFARRRTIRESWGRQLGDNFKLLFMIGTIHIKYIQKILERENESHNDLIQGTFLDTYRNVTYKHVMVFKYAIYHCPKAKYVLKLDDDVLVNVPAMKKFLTVDLSPYGASRMLFCTPREYVIVQRSYRCKWRASFTDYPKTIYPTYCPGWMLLYSPDVVFDLYKEAQISKHFWIDDIHITGILMERIHLTHSNIEPLVMAPGDLTQYLDHGYYNITRTFLLSRPDMEDEWMRDLWKYISTHPVPTSFL